MLISSSVNYRLSKNFLENIQSSTHPNHRQWHPQLQTPGRLCSSILPSSPEVKDPFLAKAPEDSENLSHQVRQRRTALRMIIPPKPQAFIHPQNR